MIALLAAAFLAAAPADVTAALRAKDQALLDAVAPGDRALWDRTLAADAVYVDENGAILDRAAFLDQLQPLSPGASGTIAIVDYQARLHGDEAIVIHRDDERERYHGQDIRAEYLMSEVWRREGGEWKLAHVHATVINRDPPAIRLSPAELDAYVGRYQEGDLVIEIRREGDHLVSGRTGGAARPLAVEARDVLFTPGAPRSRRLFQRDAQGRITGFVDRREGIDLKATRLP